MNSTNQPNDIFKTVNAIQTVKVIRAFRPGLTLNADGDDRHKALCPFHSEHTPSFTIYPDNWHCFGCNAGGSNIDFLIKANIALLPMDAANLIAKQFCVPIGNSTVQTSTLTLDEYAEYVNLDKDYLVDTFSLTVSAHGVDIPYFDETNNELGVQYRRQLRKSGNGDRRFLWKTHSKPYPYGATWGIPTWNKLNIQSVLLCEGASDVQVCWFNGVQALGMPGASSFKRPWAKMLIQFNELVIIQEPGEAGAKFVQIITQALAASKYKGQVKAVTLIEKDPRDLWLKYDSEGLRVRILRLDYLTQAVR